MGRHRGKPKAKSAPVPNNALISKKRKPNKQKMAVSETTSSPKENARQKFSTTLSSLKFMAKKKPASDRHPTNSSKVVFGKEQWSVSCPPKTSAPRVKYINLSECLKM